MREAYLGVPEILRRSVVAIFRSKTVAGEPRYRVAQAWRIAVDSLTRSGLLERGADAGSPASIYATAEGLSKAGKGTGIPEKLAFFQTVVLPLLVEAEGAGETSTAAPAPKRGKGRERRAPPPSRSGDRPEAKKTARPLVGRARTPKAKRVARAARGKRAPRA